MSKKTGRGFGWVVLAILIFGALGGAAYGIWSREQTIGDLQERADDMAVPRVHAISPKPGPKEQELTLPGELAAWNKAEIYGQVSGYIKAWYKDYGAKVAAGEVLATIETPKLDAEFAASKADLDTALARYNLAQVTARRYADLSGKGAVSQQDIDDKVAGAEAQKAEVAAARQKVAQYEAQQKFKTLVAPFAGIVAARRVNIGDYIDSQGSNATSRGSALPPFTVDQVNKLRVFVSVPQNYVEMLKPGLDADLTVLSDPGRKIKATFLTMAGAVQTDTRTVVTELVVETQPGLYPGLYVNVTFKFPGDPTILVVPSQALLFRQHGMQVALIGAKDEVHLQDVKLGKNFGTTIEITAGVKADDKLVANPSLGLLDGEKVQLVK